MTRQGGRQAGTPNKNKQFLLNRLKETFGADFAPVMKMSENTVFLQSIADESRASLTGLCSADVVDLEQIREATKAAMDLAKEANKEWDRIAKYTTPQLKAVENTFPDVVEVVEEMSDLDMARRIAFVLTKAVHDQENPHI